MSGVEKNDNFYAFLVLDNIIIHDDQPFEIELFLGFFGWLLGY